MHIITGKFKMVNPDFWVMLVSLCQNYSVTELEMTGLAININLWKHLLLRVEFDCAVDHRALPYIMNLRITPATGRIIGLLEHLSGYSFNMYYVKGKDMILCVFSPGLM